MSVDSLCDTWWWDVIDFMIVSIVLLSLHQNAVLKAELDKVTKLYHAALKRLEQYEKPNKK
jgi:hypothetical protein